MVNELQIFENPEFGQIRTIQIDGDPRFVGKDVAVALGYKDTKNALKAHVDGEDKRGWQIATPSGKQTMTIINESGLYALIFGSKLESAKRFKRWVTSEVLPSIRKTGSYTTVSQRGLTKDDYVRAASIVSGCRNERLPYVLHFLEKAGFSVPELREAAPQEAKLDLALIDALMREKRISLSGLSEMTNICKSALSYYRRGIHQPTPERYAIIIEALR